MSPAISKIKLEKLKELYIEKGLSMLDVSKSIGVSIDAVAYAMRKHDIPRRSLKEASKRSFENKEMTFKKKEIKGIKKITTEIILSMLYWGEGFKGHEDSKLTTVDFANSDPEMIRLYINSLRSMYDLDEKKLRVLLYCYSNQDISSLIDHWSKLTKIPKTQFSKPYIKSNSQANIKAMKYGLVHIRYNDKKLLIEIKNLIECVRNKYAPVE